MFEKACKGIEPEAYYNLAHMLVNGIGGPKDVPRAVDLLKKTTSGILANGQSIIYLQKIER